ncbi:MAG: M48 family metallopeptidase [Longimicrobiales bacterium]
MHPSMNRIRRAGAALVLTAGVGVGAAACSMSTQQEVELGQQYAAEINRQLPIVDDATTNQYINALGSEIARYGQRNLRYTVFIVNTDAVNAFAVPGGYVYLNRGLIDETDNLAELAGVLAHEIAHVELRHGAEQMERAQRANLGLNLAYILIGRNPSQLEQAAIQVGGSAWFASHSREAENEADNVAVDLLVASRIDPNGMVTFFMELLQERQRQPNRFEQWFSTHPLEEQRIAAVRARIQQYSAAQRANLTTNTRAYESFKNRLSRYPAPPPEFRVSP